jgi:chromosome segregation ATPase
MSVRDKIDEMTEKKRTFSETTREFEAYAVAFSDDVETKQDISHLVEGIEALQEEMRGTNESFNGYNETFLTDIARFNADVDEQREAMYEVVTLFNEYTDVFAADVIKKQDVSDLLDAVEAFRNEIAATESAFDDYESEFASDVAAIQDVSGLLAAINMLQSEFAAAEDEFIKYAATFERNVDSFHESVAEQREAFAAASDAFAEYREEFNEVEVQALLDAVVAFRAEIDNVSEEFKTTEDTFATFVREFYGQTDTGDQLSHKEDDLESKREDGSKAAPEEPDAEPEESGPPAESPAIEPSPEAEDVDDEPLKTADDEPEDAETSVNDDTTIDVETPGDMVECLVCGEYYQAITEPHLQTHDMTIQEYRDEYGDDVQLRPDNT